MPPSTPPPDDRMSRDSIAQAVDLLAGQRVLVVGDVMLDEFHAGAVERISPEAPVPVVRIETERHVLGGAANVARNLRVLGGCPTLLGVSGDDQAADRLAGLLDDLDIERHLARSPQRSTTVKTRILAHGQQIVRIDREDTSPLDAATGHFLLERLRQLIPGHQVIIVSDYGKGVVSEVLVQALAGFARTENLRILVDPKIKNFRLYRDVFLLTPNTKEAGEAAGRIIRSRDDILKAGRAILETSQARHLLITLGSDGMALFLPQGKVWHIPTTAQKVFDVTGAGDTVMATLGLALAAGMGMLTGCIMANYAAGVVVAQVGTAAVSPDELRSAIKTLPLPDIESWQD